MAISLFHDKFIGVAHVRIVLRRVGRNIALLPFFWLAFEDGRVPLARVRRLFDLMLKFVERCTRKRVHGVQSVGELFCRK